MCFLIVSSIAIIVASLLWVQSKKKNPEKILGIYSQPGKWYRLKYYAFLSLLKMRRMFTVENDHAEMEKQQQLSDHEQAVDAVFFQAVTQDGYYIATGTERRHAGKITGLFYLGTPDYGLLLSEKLPNTNLDADPQTLYSRNEYAAEGIRFKMIKPMKVWSVQYKGKMRVQRDPEKTLDVDFQAEWTANSDHFLFDSQMDVHVLAKAIAREEWSREYFDTLKQAHQTHYEQMGDLKATLTINNETRSLHMDAFRDHSCAYKRDWSLMHRYIFHMLYLENGFRASVGVISQPCTSSQLEMGYVVTPDRKNYPVTNCDILLYQHGENGNPPKCFSFSFTANGVEYEVTAEVEYEAVHFVGTDGQTRMVERFLKYRCNGVQGRGISEWNYSTACKHDK